MFRDWPNIAPVEGKKALLSQNSTQAHLKIGHPLIEFVVHLVTSATKITAFNLKKDITQSDEGGGMTSHQPLYL